MDQRLKVNWKRKENQVFALKLALSEASIFKEDKQDKTLVGGGEAEVEEEHRLLIRMDCTASTIT